MLQGGDRRSIGRSNEVVARVLADPGLFAVMFVGMQSADPLLRMRCADAAEKVTAQRPIYLQPYKRRLIGELSRVDQAEVRWHVAPMLARLTLSRRQRDRVVDILISYLNDRSSIVKTVSMQALADLAQHDTALRALVIEHIRDLLVIGTPAMKARGRKLLGQLESGEKKKA